MSGKRAPARIGVMGGTFDPIHYGHLAAAQEACVALGLSRVLFVPAGEPVHKPPRQVTAALQRWEMVLLATADHPLFFPSRVELDRPGPSYTVDTITLLRSQHPQAEWFFITGADALLEIRTWKEPHRLAQLCTIVAVTRPGYDSRLLEQHVDPTLLERILTLKVPGVAVSASEIRARLHQGLPARYLTPDVVLGYISKHGLYR